MPDFKPTDEQNAIREAVLTGENVVVQAMAGTGKTSTLQLISRDRARVDMTYLAFNRAIADEAGRKFGRNVTARTGHAFARAAVIQDRPVLLDRLDKTARVPAWQIADFLNIPGRFAFGQFSLRDRKLAGLVKETIRRFCSSAAQVPAAWMVPNVPGLDTPEARRALQDFLMPFVEKAWDDLTSDRGRLQFTHDIYLKMFSMSEHCKLPGEVVLFDEAQDADPVIQLIVERQQAEHGAQVIVVGDGNQQIYEWRGAVDAMDSFDAEHVLPLSQSFRFGPAIAEEANLLLSLLGDQRITGFEQRESSLAQLDDPDVWLTRTNAEAIALLLEAQVNGARAGLVGGTDAVQRLAQAAIDLSEGRETYHPELQAFKTWQEVQEYVEEEKDARDLKVLVDLVDRHTPSVLMDAVQRAVPEQAAELVISTAHKAKGREWSRVRLAPDFPVPIKPESGEINEPEVRLAYVAVTRAQEYLDSTALSPYLGVVARRTGAERVFLPVEEVKPREVPKAAPVEVAQVMVDPESDHRVIMTGTKYNPDLVEAQKKLRSDLRPSYRGEYCGFEKVRIVNANYAVLQVVERFGLTITDGARERIANFS